ncbi:hypothetical protein COLO4_24648 [Corchorus olitorius]|uniref:Lon N-terminal domain-containing protein n=1 Tax=Corchorus olitorius TaxID=93759 RepID=A0A1R3I8I4_9ROSI|nr:hypothetical protein COLO4_24648 [Corchorus olitorius]
MSYPVLDFSSIGINVTPRIRNAESHTTTTRRFSFYYGAKNGGELMLRVAKRRHLRPNAVLVPSETKTLHLYEARYLALLEESLLRKKLFVHFVLDPISIGNSGAEASFAARYGCLVFIESIERLDVGALVSIRGIGRVKILKFLQAEPYLKGEVRPKQDETPKEAPLQTSCLNSLQWAESELSLECDKGFFPSSAERVSFAAFQPVLGSTQSEMVKLQEEKIKAMNLKDTVQRLDNSLELIKENVSVVAAKLAIQSLGMQ